jgi:hypothetical protein
LPDFIAVFMRVRAPLIRARTGPIIRPAQKRRPSKPIAIIVIPGGHETDISGNLLPARIAKRPRMSGPAMNRRVRITSEV